MVKQIATAVALMLTHSAVAEPLELRPGMGGVADIGAANCSVFNEMHYNGPSGTRQNALTWFEGYLYANTGEHIDSVLAGQTGNLTWDFDSLTDVIVKYCRENPDDAVAEAALYLAGQLGV